jgi:pilus assembly protein CpaF
MSRQLARAQLVGPMMEGLLREIDFSRLQPGHLPNVEALCRQRLGQAATAAVRRQLGGDAAIDLLARELAEDLLCTRVFFALLQDERVTSLLAVGAERLEVERGGARESLEGVFPSEESLQRVALWMTARAGHPAHEGDPLVRTRLPDGSELQAVLPPFAPSCLLSLRRPTPSLGDLAGLALHGVVPAGLVPVLHALVSARLTLLVAGGTEDSRGAVVDALLSAVAPADRVVVMDPDGTLATGLAGAIRLRPGPGAEGGVLLEAAARLRPERLVLRGLDADTTPGFLRVASATARGSIATLEACSPRDAVDRVVAQLARTLGDAAAHRLLAATVSAVLFLGQRADGQPVLEALAGLTVGDGERIALHEVVRFHRHPDGGGTFAGSGARPALAEQLEQRGHKLPASAWRFQQTVA